MKKIHMNTEENSFRLTGPARSTGSARFHMNSPLVKIFPFYQKQRVILFIYFLDLKSDLENFPANGGILDGVSGTHVTGSERDGEIPIICKRNLYILFRKILKLVDKNYTEVTKPYSAQKQCSVVYKKKKNEFFERIEMLNLGRYPIVDREIDSFTLCPEDVQS